jgi:PilZ domain.
MKERRKAERLKELNEITISVTCEENNITKNKLLYNYSKDISVSGAKIQSNIFLPVDTLLKIDFKLKTLEKQITALGKVKWIKVLIEDKSYEAGVEFVDTPSEAIKKLKFYILQIRRLHRGDKKGNGSKSAWCAVLLFFVNTFNLFHTVEVAGSMFVYILLATFRSALAIRPQNFL